MLRYAVLPTRDAVLLPGAVNELQVGRPGSVAALRYAAEHGDQVLVVLQRDAGLEDPGPEDLHDVGTICRITDAERMSADAACIGVVGVERVRIGSVERSGDALFALVESLGWAPKAPVLGAVLEQTLPLVIEHGLRGVMSARSFGALEAKSATEMITALSVVAPVGPAKLQRVLETGELQPIADGLESLRDQSWLARFLRWVRR